MIMEVPISDNMQPRFVSSERKFYWYLRDGERGERREEREGERGAEREAEGGKERKGVVEKERVCE